MDANIPATVTEQIEEAKSEDISYRALHPDGFIFDKVSGRTIRIPYSALSNKYKDYLSKIIVSRELDKFEQKNYHCNPKALSEELYGSPEFWDTLLILNNCKSIIDFKPKVVKYYDPDYLKEYINEIMILEDDLGNITY